MAASWKPQTSSSLAEASSAPASPGTSQKPGWRNVLIVERESHQGKGSTGKSMGGVRAQFATAPNIQMSMYSIPFYAEFDERLGQPGGYRPQGYLFVATADSTSTTCAPISNCSTRSD